LLIDCLRHQERSKRLKALGDAAARQPNALAFERLWKCFKVVQDIFTITPWNLSKKFVDIYRHNKGARGMLDLKVLSCDRRCRDCWHPR
jgi:hypothetical protein